jgi:hypothetical protein
MPNPNPTAASQLPAPGTAVAVHLLVGGGRIPLVAADLRQIVDKPIVYLRAEVDDVPRHGTRHTLDVTFSGPPADVAALVAQMTAALRAAEPTGDEAR